MGSLLAAAAAFANAMTTILQRLGVKDAPASDTMRVSLIRYALHRRVWLAGFGVMVASFLLQATALDMGEMTSVQPVLTLELPFLVLILAVWFRLHPRWQDWVATAVAAGGLAAFLMLAAPSAGHVVPNLVAWGEVSFACLAGMATFVGLARFGSPSWRAAMFGVAGAIGFALTATFIKATTDLIAQGWGRLLMHWQPYAVAGAGVLSVFLAQNAFHSGPVTASQSTLVTVDPLVSISIGIGLFGDRLRTAGARGPLESLALLAMLVGVVLLARSPLVVKAKDVEDTGLRIDASAKTTRADGTSAEGGGHPDAWRTC